MKVFLGLFLLVAVSSAAELYERRLLGNHLEDLVTETLEYIRSLMKKHNPSKIPDIPDQHLQDTDIDLVISGTDVEVYDSSDFVINSIKVDSLNLKSSFQITFPVNHHRGNYKISGTVWGKKVEGAGKFTIDLTNFVQSIDSKMTVVDHSIQVQDLSVDFSIGDFKINVDGLSIEGMEKDQINELLSKQFLKYITENKALVEEHTAVHAKNVANKMLYGHNLAELIDWLKKLVASTPDPFPIPSL